MTNLNALFNARTQRSFENQMAVADRLSQLALRRQMSIGETLDALITSLVSIVQARAQATEWAEVGETLADEIQRRLTVTGDTGEEHHARRMM